MTNIKLCTIALICAFIVSCSNDDDAPSTTITVKDFATTMEENPSINQEIGTIEATTNQGEITFSIKSGTPEGAIIIDKATGTLSVKKASLFDYETYPELIAVVVIKNGEVIKEVKVTITLNDIDDSEPTTVTVKDFTTTIEENPENDQKLGTLEATTNRGELSFSLKSQDPEGAITIDPSTGELSVKDPSLFDPDTHSKITAIVLVENEGIRKEANIEITYKNTGKNIVFPDGIFKEALLKHDPIIDTDGNGEISFEEAKNVEKTRLSAKITDLTGIEHFTNLKWLGLKSYVLKSVDLSKNIVLEEFHSVFTLNLETINISKNRNLKVLNITKNRISTIDVSACINLEVFNIQLNSLTALNVTKNTKLKKLSCGGNLLTSLDVSKNPVLESLSFGNDIFHLKKNQIHEIDLSNNTALNTLSCNDLLLTELNLSTNSALEKLNVLGNQLTFLNLKNGATANLEKNNVHIQNNASTLCVQVDDPSASYIADWVKDPGTQFKSVCD
ncbi:cadherin repeat domain-containing protein [Aquimarina spinulae]|uniref:cadherin repeat domain-containing protein n=1 Tax=Aquimarina spinulae TaxID=1192023 RepID=UPI001053F079|nr:cadherin repeat domain-containing protein [Aquimarina spinulae]